MLAFSKFYKKNIEHCGNLWHYMLSPQESKWAYVVKIEISFDNTILFGDLEMGRENNNGAIFHLTVHISVVFQESKHKHAYLICWFSHGWEMLQNCYHNWSQFVQAVQNCQLQANVFFKYWCGIMKHCQLAAGLQPDTQSFTCSETFPMAQCSSRSTLSILKLKTEKNPKQTSWHPLNN